MTTQTNQQEDMSAFERSIMRSTVIYTELLKSSLDNEEARKIFERINDEFNKRGVTL